MNNFYKKRSLKKLIQLKKIPQTNLDQLSRILTYYKNKYFLD